MLKFSKHLLHKCTSKSALCQHWIAWISTLMWCAVSSHGVSAITLQNKQMRKPQCHVKRTLLRKSHLWILPLSLSYLLRTASLLSLGKASPCNQPGSPPALRKAAAWKSKSFCKVHKAIRKLFYDFCIQQNFCWLALFTFNINCQLGFNLEFIILDLEFWIVYFRSLI